jgi:hypothetical protein
MHSARHAYLIFLDLITLIIFSKEYKSRSPRFASNQGSVLDWFSCLSEVHFYGADFSAEANTDRFTAVCLFGVWSKGPVRETEGCH